MPVDIAWPGLGSTGGDDNLFSGGDDVPVVARDEECMSTVAVGGEGI